MHTEQVQSCPKFNLTVEINQLEKQYWRSPGFLFAQAITVLCWLSETTFIMTVYGHCKCHQIKGALGQFKCLNKNVDWSNPWPVISGVALVELCQICKNYLNEVTKVLSALQKVEKRNLINVLNKVIWLNFLRLNDSNSELLLGNLFRLVWGTHLKMLFTNEWWRYRYVLFLLTFCIRWKFRSNSCCCAMFMYPICLHLNPESKRVQMVNSSLSPQPHSHTLRGQHVKGSTLSHSVEMYTYVAHLQNHTHLVV